MAFNSCFDLSKFHCLMLKSPRQSTMAASRSFDSNKEVFTSSKRFLTMHSVSMSIVRDWPLTVLYYIRPPRSTTLKIFSTFSFTFTQSKPINYTTIIINPSQSITPQPSSPCLNPSLPNTPPSVQCCNQNPQTSSLSRFPPRTRRVAR